MSQHPKTDTDVEHLKYLQDLYSLNTWYFYSMKQPFVNAAMKIAAEGNSADQMAHSVSSRVNFMDFIKLVNMDAHGPAHYYYKGNLE